ncbi:MAG TPA: response regulator [Polyangia bacterium]|nr:response regulator [Polyangia bacterium]
MKATTDGDGRLSVPARILLAEDDPELRSLLAEALRRDGHLVMEVSNGVALDDVIRELAAQSPVHADEIVISDVRMPGRTGLSVLQSHRGCPWCPRFIFMTGFGDDELRAEAVDLGAAAVIEKPFEFDELRGILEDVTAH